MNIKDEIWALIDNRPGTAAQAIGLAEEICRETNLELKTINLTYSNFSKLPNLFLSKSPLRLSKKSREELKEIKHLPKIIISSGRKSAPIALYLQSLQKNKDAKVTLVQIMRPNINFDKFDYVILPKHDKISGDPTNVIRSIGSLTKINDQNIKNSCQKFSSEFEAVKNPRIALFIGGDSKKTTFCNESAIKLAKISSNISNNMGGSLIVANSRRTSDKITDSIKSNLNCDFKFFDWKKVENNNPYLAIVGYADFFIVSGDSVSMISECCSTGKPVYIFDDKNISSNKQRVFHKNLIAANHAKELNKELSSLAQFSQKQLQETKRISSLITSKF